VKIFLALAVIVVTASCKRSGDGIQRNDTVKIPPSPASTTTSPAPRNCGITGLPVLTDNGIGDLKAGARVSDVRERCEVLSDSREQGSEGMMERIVVVRVGSETVRALVGDDRIVRLEVTSPQLTTSDSLGVDTPLHRIATARGARFVPGEDGVYGFVADHCAMSFRFSVPLRPPRGGDWTAAKIDSAHGEAAVDRILVTKCQH
jgi:hypothetical protein